MKKPSAPSTSTQKLLMFLVPALVVVQIAAFIFLHFANRQIALDSVDAALEAGAQTFTYTAATRREYRRLTSELVTKDYGLVNTIANESRETVESALHNQLGRTGAELIVLTDLQGRLIARATTLPLMALPDPDLDQELASLVSHVAEQERNMRPLSVGEDKPALHNWVKVVIRAPVPVAQLYLAYRISDTSVQQYTKMTQLQMAFVSERSDAESAPVVHASTLPAAAMTQEVAQYKTLGESFSVTTDEGQYRLKVLELGGLPGYRVHAVVAKPFAPVFSPFIKLELLFAASIVFSSVVSILAAKMITSRVVTPLEKVAQRDALTGLANRRLFEINIANAEQNLKALNDGFTLMLLDLNKFKQVNDTFGHEAGDTVLQTFAARVKKLMRASDTLARLGGDEFAVLMRTTDKDKATALAAAIVEAVRQPLQLPNGEWVEVGTSIGIAFSPAHSSLGSEVMHHADIAMYAAKKRGGGFLIAELPAAPAPPEGAMPRTL